MILAAGAVITLSWQRTSPGGGPSENISENFGIFVSAGSDSHLYLTQSASPETISQETRVTIENTAKNQSKTIALSYSSSVQGDWLSVEFSPQSGVPSFTSTVTVSVDTGSLQGYTGTFQITIIGTSSENVSNSVPIQVTVQ
jgi:hypothetical protein